MAGQLALHRALLAAGLVALAPSCFNQYDKFDLLGGNAAAGASNLTGGDGAGGAETGGGAAGTDNMGGNAGTTAGGGQESGGSRDETGGAEVAGGGAGPSGGTSTGGVGTGGSTGGSPCGTGQKLCGASCVPDDDPQTGCAQASCGPCPVPANATVACQSGACGMGSCNAGYLDCNTSATDGCEHSLNTFSTTRCGGCGNSCVSQGLGSCQGGACRCTSSTDCSDRAGPTCNTNRNCVCSGTECQPGEKCARSGSNFLCRCNGGATCIAGTVCCYQPNGCVDLQSDAANCGACGWACPAGQGCVGGVCQ
jgi:hypothetical protein